MHKRKKIPLEKLCRCENCGAESCISDNHISDIVDLLDRIDPGGEVPAGECKKCGALTYLVQNPSMKDRASLLRSAAAFLEGDDLGDRERVELTEDLLAEADRIHPEN